MTDNTKQEEQINTVFTPDMIFEQLEQAMDPEELLQFLYEKQEHVRDQVKANFEHDLDEMREEHQSLQKDVGTLDDLSAQLEDVQDSLNAAEEFGENQHCRAEEYKGYAEKHMLLMGISADDIDAQYE